MSRILAIWELGANMGHIDRLLITARALRQRGHEVRFLLKDLSRAHARVAAEGFAMGQAPVWLPRAANPPRLLNYAVVLMGAGWMDPQGLAGLIAGWRDAIALARPDALLCDHAPTAILASRGSGVPVWSACNSFELPPLGAYFPPLQINPDAAELARCPGYDGLLLAPTNEALALLGEAPLARLTDIFTPVHKALVTLPELAHYIGHAADTLWAGPSYVGDAGVAPVWPVGGGPRVFAYIEPSHAEFNALLAALKALDWPTLVHARGLSAEAAQRLGGPRIRFEPMPVQVDPAMALADLVISHASLGTVTAAALAGKPQLVLPSHAEQAMVADRLVRAGLGLAALPDRGRAHHFEPLLRKLALEPTFSTAAQALARRHAGANPQRTGQRLADLIEATL